MEKRIYKYQLDVTDWQVLMMPKDAEILTVQIQNGNVCMWALVDVLQSPREREFHIYGTGNPITDETKNLKYISTFQMRDGRLVFHVFEKI